MVKGKRTLSGIGRSAPGEKGKNLSASRVGVPARKKKGMQKKRKSSPA